jgi:hypothetical protein
MINPFAGQSELDFHYLVPLKTVTGISPYQKSWGVSLKIAIRNLED